MNLTAAYDESSVRQGLTFLAKPWFSADMTQRNIHRTHSGIANIATPAHAIAQRIPLSVLNAALAALVLVVVVLITTPTGAG
jgi:hypothetical protein